MFYNHSYQNRPKNNLMLEGTIEQLTFFTPIRVEYISRSNFYFRMMYCIYLSVFKWLNHDIHILIEKYYCFYNSHFFLLGIKILFQLSRNPHFKPSAFYTTTYCSLPSYMRGLHFDFHVEDTFMTVSFQ
jgi:hypothetical protein